jgi:hypothetical protein
VARPSTSSAYDAAAIVGVTVWGEAEGGLVIDGEFNRFSTKGSKRRTQFVLFSFFLQKRSMFAFQRNNPFR